MLLVLPCRPDPSLLCGARHSSGQPLKKDLPFGLPRPRILYFGGSPSQKVRQNKKEDGKEVRGRQGEKRANCRGAWSLGQSQMRCRPPGKCLHLMTMIAVFLQIVNLNHCTRVNLSTTAA